jgi:hypothetical protein
VGPTILFYFFFLQLYPSPLLSLSRRGDGSPPSPKELQRRMPRLVVPVLEELNPSPAASPSPGCARVLCRAYAVFSAHAQIPVAALRVLDPLWLRATDRAISLTDGSESEEFRYSAGLSLSLPATYPCEAGTCAGGRACARSSLPRQASWPRPRCSRSRRHCPRADQRRLLSSETTARHGPHRHRASRRPGRWFPPRPEPASG